MDVRKIGIVVAAGCLTNYLFATDDTIFGQESMEMLKDWHGKNPVKCCAFINQQKGPEKGTILHVAAENAGVDCVEQLLACGARANMQDVHGKTPLDYALARTDEEAAAVISALQEAYPR